MSDKDVVDISVHSIAVNTYAYGKYCAKNIATKEYCRFLTFAGYGTIPICSLFEKELYSEDLIERCAECLSEY